MQVAGHGIWVKNRLCQLQAGRLMPRQPRCGKLFPMIDLRSDTVTKPTPGMLAAMQAAAVGDDVYGEDPTVNALVRADGDNVQPDRRARALPAGR
jgi:hypothetical protein